MRVSICIYFPIELSYELPLNLHALEKKSYIKLGFSTKMRSGYMVLIPNDQPNKGKLANVFT